MAPTATHQCALRHCTPYRQASSGFGSVRTVQRDPFQVSANWPKLRWRSLSAIARQAEDDEHDTLPKAWSDVPAGSGGARIRQVGVDAAPVFPAAGPALGARPAASAITSPATAASAPGAVTHVSRLVVSMYPRTMPGQVSTGSVSGLAPSCPSTRCSISGPIPHDRPRRPARPQERLVLIAGVAILASCTRCWGSATR